MGQVVYYAWAIVGAVTLMTVGAGLFFGYRGWWTLVLWRRIKLVSTMFGVLAIVFLMMNAENSLRSYWLYGLTPANVLLFTDIRLEVADQVLSRCPLARTDRVCADLIRLQTSMDWFHSYVQSQYIEQYDKSRFAPELGGLIDSINNKIGFLKLGLMRPEPWWGPSADARAIIFFFAALFLALALGGSIGEAAYQLQQAEKDVRAKAAASVPSSSAAG
jgi:hypothetical protein